MFFLETKLEGVFIIEPEKLEDERGFFARTWCRREFEDRGISARFVQCNISFNKKKGTLRGMHFQTPPREEAKLVRCTRGAIYDVVIDLRPSSPTFKRWIASELTADNRYMIYIPEGCAHGFQTLTNNAELFYQMSEYFNPEAASGVRWDDPIFGIEWPLPNPILSVPDKSYSDFKV